MIEKIQKVIDSCKNEKQLKVAVKYIKLAEEKKLIPNSELYLLMQKLMVKIDQFHKI